MNKYDIKTYFKRVKQPITRPEQAKPLKDETKVYMAVFLGVGIVFSALGGAIESLNIPLSLIGIVGFIVGFYFALMLYAMNRATARLANLTCSKCGTSLNNSEYASWEEISRRWADRSDSRSAEAKLYVTVKFTCVCPHCGEVKIFNETLCSGKIRVTDYSVRDTLISTQKLVDDYFNGLIHA